MVETYNDRLDALTHRLIHTGSASGSGELVGEVKAWAGTGAVPLAFILCNGQAVSRTAYAALFATIGTTYGPGDGSTTFNVPDLQDRTLYGSGATVGAVGAAFGSASSVATHQHPHSTTHAHGHSATHSHTVNNHNHFSPTGGISNNHTHTFTTGDVDRLHNHVIPSVVFMNCSATHGHGGGCGQPSEAASYGGCTGFGCTFTSNTENTGHLHSGTTAGVSNDHTHVINGDTPGTNAVAPGSTDAISAGTSDNTGVANGNYPPGRIMRFLIRI